MLVASQLGLPVSTTHIVVGGVFGVGFFREYYTTHSRRRRAYVRTHRLHQPRRISKADQEDLRRRKLVRRSHFMGIVAAWAITVPSAAALAALIFYAVQWVQ